MLFFAWGINKPGVKDRRTAVVHDHWNFIDLYDDRLIARGPVLDPADAAIVTGSIHILELDDWDAAKKFAYDEPFAANGLFEDIILTPYSHELGRTQFEFVKNPDRPRFFIYCPATADKAEAAANLKTAQDSYCDGFDANCVCRGSLLDTDGNWAGRVFLMEFEDAEAAAAFIADEPCHQAGLYTETRISRWTLGGRENLNASGALD